MLDKSGFRCKYFLAPVLSSYQIQDGSVIGKYKNVLLRTQNTPALQANPVIDVSNGNLTEMMGGAFIVGHNP